MAERRARARATKITLICEATVLLVALSLGVATCGCASSEIGTTTGVSTVETVPTTTLAPTTTESATTTSTTRVAKRATTPTTLAQTPPTSVPPQVHIPEPPTTSWNGDCLFAGAYSGDYSFDDFEPKGSIHFVVDADGSVTGSGNLGQAQFVLAGSVMAPGALIVSGKVGYLEATYTICFSGHFLDAAPAASGSCCLGNVDDSPRLWGTWYATRDGTGR